jgi:Zn-dependent membrane protease YugP
MIYWIIFIGFALLSWLISNNLKSAFKEYSKVPTVGNLTGREIAEKMLHDNDIYDVQVTCIEGQLSDNYNPLNKTLNLSRDVYYGDSVASGAVAAHECGHAVQHAHQYAWLMMRSRLVPVVSFASRWVMWILLIGMFCIKTFPQLMEAGIVLFALTTLFSFITLPVEINASQRALAWLSNHNITTQ